MTTWQEPTGRERAIEALMDRDKDGDFYRVRKVMEEAVPAALRSRPNKVPKAALVDQAFCLQEHVIETAIHHSQVFGRDVPKQVDAGRSPVFEIKSYVWKHQESIRSAKNGARVGPPPELDDALTTFFEGSSPDSSSAATELLNDLKHFIEKHCLMEQINQGGTVETIPPDSPSAREEKALAACEGLVSNLTKLIDAEEHDEIYSGIWIVIRAILTLEQRKIEKKEAGESSASSPGRVGSGLPEDVEPPLFLQVGALLPFFCVRQAASKEDRVEENSEETDLDLNAQLLHYFAAAAAAHQERLEVMEARKKLQEGINKPITADESAEGNNRELSDIFSTPSADSTSHHQRELGATSDANETSERGMGAEPGGDPTGQQRENGVDNNEGNTRPGEDNNEPMPADADPQSSDASSSSSSDGSSSTSSDGGGGGGGGGEGVNHNPQADIPEAAAFVESERDISTDDDDDAVLREALGISLERGNGEAEAVRVILADHVLPMADDSLAPHPTAETPVSEDVSAGLVNMVSGEESDPLAESNNVPDPDETSPLPQLPTPPVPYPWRNPDSAHRAGSDPDATSQNMSPSMDPSNLSQFAAVPSAYALLHILKYAEYIMERQELVPATIETPPPAHTFPGGMGHELFTMKKDARLSPDQSIPPADRSFVFQLLVSSLLSIAEKRNNAIESLNRAMSRERLAARGGDSDQQGGNDSISSGGEEDDPALTFALNYVEDDVSLSVESLENKGMKRKAAAAAHDAEALRKTLRKRTAAWKAQVELFSRCLLSTLRCLTAFLQCATRTWLKSIQGGRRRSSLARSIEELKIYLPSEALLGLAGVFSFLLDSSEVRRDDKIDMLFSKQIQNESLLAWAESFPLLCASTKEKFDTINSLLKAAARQSSGPGPSSLGPIGPLPKLQSLARRIRVKDVLESLIPSPIPCFLEGQGETSSAEAQWPRSLLPELDDSAHPQSDRDLKSSLPSASALILKLSESSLRQKTQELQHLLYALCYRMNVVSFLFEGLYAITETETEKASNMASSKSKDSSGNSIVLNKSPSGNFVFDATKCSDSIAILTGPEGGNGSTVLQRASKVWGTVHSSQFYSPRTGVHRWAVRLDKCERGHVFVGVATSRANVRTYVGGDKYGWGMIGTQALWHDRRKIRGDYGASFRTGSTVIVTLDTNLGTLSLGLWKDTPSGAQDGMVQNLLSPKKHGQIGGTIEDWGIAFEGLPLDSKMYPAVGLYQRDDRVTLLSVDSDVSGQGGSIETIGGKSFYPPSGDLNIPRSLKTKNDRARQINDALNWDGTQYAANLLERASAVADEHPEDLKNLLPSVLASICLLPGSVPLLSQRSALTLLPKVDQCLKTLVSKKVVGLDKFDNSLVEGEWVIRATTGEGDLEEYVVKFERVFDNKKCIGFKGNGVGTTGKSKNGIVSIYGTVNGYAVSFLEEWSDEGNKVAAIRDDSSSCVVFGAVSLDGTRLEGRYRNMEFGTTGKVSGILKNGSISTHQPEADSVSSSLSKVETLLCLAHSHLAAVIADDAANDSLVFLLNEEGKNDAFVNMPVSNGEKLSSLLKKPFLADACLSSSGKCLIEHLNKLAQLYSPPVSSALTCGPLQSLIGLVAGAQDNPDQGGLSNAVHKADALMVAAHGKRGSLSSINPKLYDSTRIGVIKALLWNCDLSQKVFSLEDTKLISDPFIINVWQTASVVMEDGLRGAIGRSLTNMREAFQQRCETTASITGFLLELQRDTEACVADIKFCYESIDGETDIGFLKTKMNQATVSGVLHLSAIENTCEILNDCPTLSHAGVESAALGVCRLMAHLSGSSSGIHGVRRLPGKGGSGLHLRKLLDKSIHRLFLLFVEKCNFAIRQRGLGISQISADSLVLACLGVFILCLEVRGAPSVVSFLSKTRDILLAHRSALCDIDVSIKDPVRSVKLLAERDVSYAVLRCATAAVHLCFYQLSIDPSRLIGSESIYFPVNWFISELSESLQFLESVFGSAASRQVAACGVEEWARWLHCPASKSEDKIKGIKNDSGAVTKPQTLMNVGTIQHLDFTAGPRSSAVFRQEGRRYTGGPGHRHLSHWLHILCTTLRAGSSDFRSSLLNGAVLLSVLLRAVGLDLVRGKAPGLISNVELRRRDKGLLPARYRARVAFFLGHVLPDMNPNAEVIEGLFTLAGSDILMSSTDTEDILVSREVVSLLRRLYEPERGAWRDTLNRVVSSLMKGDGLVQRTGLHAFLSGIITSVSKLSFVLLKPAVASPVNLEGHISGGKVLSGTGHSMVVGADAILSGLLRSTADGGIVSNVDEKNGVCEVILTTRSDELKEYDSDDCNVANFQGSNERPGLTVRALRTPIADVIIAQDFPLYLDEKAISPSLVCDMLNGTLESLLSAAAPSSIALGIDETLLEEPPSSDTATPRSDLIKEGSPLDVCQSTASAFDREAGLGLGHHQVSTGVQVSAHVAPIPEKVVSEQQRHESSFTDKQPLETRGSVGQTAMSPEGKLSELHRPPEALSTPAPEARDKQKPVPLDAVSTGVYGLFLDVMTLRSAIVLFSHPKFFRRVMEDVRCRAVLFRTLCLAWPEDAELSKNHESILEARQSDMSCLPLHELKLFHLMSMLKDVTFREQVLINAPKSVWEDRVPEYAKAMKERRENESMIPASLANEPVGSSGTHPDTQPNRSASHSTGGSQNEDEEEQHLREAAIAQIGELGIPRSYAELALRRIGGTNIEAAVHFCLENGSEIERLLAEEIQRQAGGQPGRARPREDGQLLQQLMEMGFPRRWCTEALAATGNNVDEALTWILSNNETLESLEDEETSEQEEEEEEEDDEPSDEDAEDEDDGEASDEEAEDDHKDPQEPGAETVGVPTTTAEEPVWSAAVAPLRVVSGRAAIDPSTLEVSGQSSGGFASVGARVLLKSGKWYYEVVLGTAGCIQLGFGDASFGGHCNADRGDGCGDSSSSFSFDGWRRLRWHMTATEWGCRWKEGDVVGCMVDIDERIMSFTLNGEGERIGMGVAFTGFNFCGGLYPVVSFNRRERLRLILGGSGPSFRFPPPGYRGVGEALIESVNERDALMEYERILGKDLAVSERYLPDFSDEEHGNELFSWSHRYYGSDASVHLGSSRLKSSSTKMGETGQMASRVGLVSKKLEDAWRGALTSEEQSFATGVEILASVRNGYETVLGEIAYDIYNEATAYAVALCRKLLFHAIITDEEFDATKLCRRGGDGVADLVRLWFVIEAACSSRNWSGEAGAMAMAAEALGLGIQVQSRQAFERLGLTTDETLVVHRPCLTQLLTSLVRRRSSGSDSSFLFAAAAEWNTNPSVFITRGIASALAGSDDFRRVVSAAVRRSVRLLSGIEEGDAKNDDAENEGSQDEAIGSVPTDARFVSFFTGVLLSTPIKSLSSSWQLELELFQAWSVGLLSASLPWRMVSAFVATAILERNPTAFAKALTPTLARFYGRLYGTVARRAWAERAAYPICSRYIASMVGLLHAVRKSVAVSSDLPVEFLKYWGRYENEASSPQCLQLSEDTVADLQVEEGWISNEEIWTGQLTYDEIAWKNPGKSSVRSLGGVADGEDGPPMLREGCSVMRGPDWNTSGGKSEDGHDIYEAAKEQREKEMKASKEAAKEDESCSSAVTGERAGKDEPREPVSQKAGGSGDGLPGNLQAPKKRKSKIPHPKLPIGTVISIERWNGVPAMGRRVRWTLTGEEGVYRFGGDGGRHDIIHVETNERRTRVIKKYPFPETAEQCAARRGFGSQRSYSVLLRFKTPLDERSNATCGILELPDFGAAVRVSVLIESECKISVREDEILYGSKDSGWEARFGQPSYVPGSVYDLQTQEREIEQDLVSPHTSCSEVMKGSAVFNVATLRNPDNGGPLAVRSTLSLSRGRRTKSGKVVPGGVYPPPLSFDKFAHAPNLAISKDGRSVTCTAADGRGCAFAEIGFSKGCHYWEVKIESCESGSIFIGCAEKPSPEANNRFNRWLGWGFVNFRATYSSGSEKVYGVHAHSGDTVGVLLDCDAGRISFFYDGLKYGEHILNDLGCAFENMSPFGFSVEGCGTGGQGQGATSGFPRSPAQGFVRPKTLFPVVGLRNHGDRVTLCPGWTSTYGVDGTRVIENILRVVDTLDSYSERKGSYFDDATIKEAFLDYEKWRQEKTVRTRTRGCRNYEVELDTSAFGCAAASAALGLETVLLPGDRLRLKRSSGRLLELTEEAVILGQHQLRLYYKIVLQKNEGASLTEGGDLPYFLEECDVVEGIEFVKMPGVKRPALSVINRFKWSQPGGLKVVYGGGAVIRSDVEINDASKNIGSIPTGTIISPDDILERRVNSCGVVRFRVRHNDIVGYISGNIRGGTEEPIVEPVISEVNTETSFDKSVFETPYESAEKWVEEARLMGISFERDLNHHFKIADESIFRELVSNVLSRNTHQIRFDELLVAAISALGDSTSSADALQCSFSAAALTLSRTFKSSGDFEINHDSNNARVDAVAVVLAELDSWDIPLPSLEVVLARLSLLRILNMRARFALPWLPLRLPQEGSAFLGGLNGFGPSVDKSGRLSKSTQVQGWWKSPSVAMKVRSHRGLFFTSVKREFLSTITEATSTATPLSHDEYELPREIRTVRINRMRAARAMESADVSIKRKYSVFSQLQNETKSWGGASLRRGYIAKGHGGQKRAFKVKFVGEGVNDYSGPYREVFAEAMNEALKVDNDGNGVLAVLDSSPNTVAGIGEHQGLFVFSKNGQARLSDMMPSLPTGEVDPRELEMRKVFASLICSRNEASREVEEALIFLGRLVGTAYRHGILVDLPLPITTFWKPVVEDVEDSLETQLAEIDVLAAKGDLSTPLLWWQKRMLNFFVEGLSNVIPVEVLPLFTARELRETMCGSSDVDVEMLKRIVEYEGYTGDEPVIQHFWNVLRNSTTADRKAFLQYVWARNRLPSRVADFETPFKIQKDIANSGAKADLALPSASTCFFSLTLPEYSNMDILRQKLMFAIHNVTTMETDFQTNSAEIKEGYQALI